MQTTIRQLPTIGELEVVLMATGSHLPVIYETHPRTLKAFEEAIKVPHQYDLGILEGCESEGADALLVMEHMELGEHEDLFFDPLSPGAYCLFRVLHPRLSDEEVAAMYYAAWHTYGEHDGYGHMGYSNRVVEVFKEVYGMDVDTGERFGPAVDRLNEKHGDAFTTFNIETLMHLIHVVNKGSEKRITERLRGYSGRVFFFCGDRHEEAVTNALDTLRDEYQR